MGPKKGAISIGSGQFPEDYSRHKKARKAFTLRAFRTSMMVLVTINQEFWWSWRNLNKVCKLMKLIVFSQFNFGSCT